MHDLSTTLVAVATAPGRGGIGCVRLSGPDARAIARALCRRADSPSDAERRPRFVTFVGRDGAALDHGYAVAFPEGGSYTGEPVVELWAHGSPPVLQELLSAAVACGARLAGPGEFTYRAIRNGRLDLPQAEAIRDLIAARTAYQARVAFSQLHGALSRRLAPLKEALLDLVARGEAAIEFADEAETHLENGRLAQGVAAALADARVLREEAQRGRVVRDGARVTLSGVTSVGKSSLFNRLLGRDRAIVSPVPGTTRDTIEETVDLEGIPVTLVDTAGLRAAGDAVEAEGVRRAREAAGEADLVVVVLDGTRAPGADEREALSELAADGARRGLVVVNKSDAAPAGACESRWPGAIPVSARTGDGLDELRRRIRRAVAGPEAVECPAITDARQAAAIQDVVSALERAQEAAGLGDEIVLEELRQALRSLSEITGEIGGEDLYDRIFSTFCIGK